jgi:AcrR family transcriptional regulator
MFCYHAVMSAPRTARARVRAELTREILAAAHEELASEGASALSLRAVARRLEMVPSALYRYFPNRAALLTALIIDAYEAVAVAAAEADQGAGADCLDRWLAVTAAVRRWGHEHPHEWALVYGSPVPGYHAPQDTVAAALEVTTVLCGIFAAATPPTSPAPMWLPAAPPDRGKVLEPLQAALLPGRVPEVVAVALLAWTQLFGMVSLELFGHYVGATTDFDATFDYIMRVVGRLAGLPGA